MQIAFREVHDALVVNRTARDILAAETERRDQLRAALEVARAALRRGPHVVPRGARRAAPAAAAETLRIAAARDTQLSIVEFAKSLGGGWEPFPLDPAHAVAPPPLDPAADALDCRSPERPMRTPTLALLSMLAAAAGPALAQSPAPAQPVVPQQVACRGDDPFWHLDAGRTTGVLEARRRPGEAAARAARRAPVARACLAERAGVARNVDAPPVRGRRRDHARAGVQAGRRRTASGWQAIVSLRPGETLAGCCVVRRGYDAVKAPLAAFAQKKDGDWARRWPEVGAAVQRCVTDAGVPVREVAKAWSPDASTVAVRMTAADGRALACTVAANARGKPQVAPLAAGEALPAGANAPVYYPAREAPIVACGRLERIAAPGPRARTEGWLHYERC